MNMKRCFLSLGVILGLVSSCSSSKETVSQNNANVDEIYGQPSAALMAAKESNPVSNPAEFHVKMESNPSTGFRWVWINKDDAAAELLEHKFIGNSTSPMMVGAGGVEEWIFKVKDSGADSLVFVYKRGNEQIDEQVHKIPK